MQKESLVHLQGRIFRETGFELDQLAPINDASTNQVFRCTARKGRLVLGCYLKVARTMLPSAVHPLQNEAAVLASVSIRDFAVPNVLASGSSPLPYLLMTALSGTMVWDYVDPRRGVFAAEPVLQALSLYGSTLAKIHALPIEWAPQRRRNFETLDDVVASATAEFTELVSWLTANAPAVRNETFVHGDFNVANVLVEAEHLVGVLDWEYAGRGWKEYELAWALRARTHFLNSHAQRQALLEGYSSIGAFDDRVLRWCEVLNYLRFALWNRDSDEAYCRFALEHAKTLIEAHL